MRKIICTMLFGLTLVAFLAGAAFAGEIDILVDKLVEKGILSYGEAQQILTETKEEVRKEIAQGKSDALPSWLQKIKLKGDLRLRHQWNKRKASEERHRGRVRYRLGADAKINKIMNVAAGLCSGSSDPRSTNQTFENTFDTPDIRLDYAYVNINPFPWLSLYGGKMDMKPILWQTTDLLWDGDIRPEGGALAINYTPFEDVSLGLFLTSGIFVLDESSGDTSDPLLYYFQPGMKWTMNENLSLKTALAIYGTNSVKGHGPLDNWGGTNAMESQRHMFGANHYEYDYSSLNPSVQLDINNPFGGLVPYAAIFAEAIDNLDADDDDNGYAAGIKFGDKKVKKFGQWQFKYVYRRLEQDGFLDTFPDSDAWDGATGIKGHEAILTLGLNENATLGFDFYNIMNLESTDHPSEQLLQTDLLFKF